jgi:hypothetical protein
MGEYPTNCQLDGIKQADIFKIGLDGMVELIRECWSDYGKLEFDGSVLFLATGGWSGNEDIINALADNIVFWSKYWKKSERGGGYTFEL